MGMILKDIKVTYKHPVNYPDSVRTCFFQVSFTDSQASHLIRAHRNQPRKRLFQAQRYGLVSGHSSRSCSVRSVSLRYSRF